MLHNLTILLAIAFFVVLMVIGIIIENWAAAAFAVVVILALIWEMLRDG